MTGPHERTRIAIFQINDNYSTEKCLMCQDYDVNAKSRKALTARHIYTVDYKYLGRGQGTVVSANTDCEVLAEIV